MAVTGAEIEHSIKGVRFPASIDDLAEQANKNNANENIIHYKRIAQQNILQCTRCFK